MEFDQDYCLGLTTILKEVIEEVEGIGLTKEKVAELFRRYASILTDTPIEIDDQAVENGG